MATEITDDILIICRVAKSQQYDMEGLVEIFKLYGDHLYTKGNHGGAMEQYLKTIGRLEPSYVIKKFLDAQRINQLTAYLQELHKQGLASEDHTTLLLNCYTKLRDTERLNEFLNVILFFVINLFFNNAIYFSSLL